MNNIIIKDSKIEGKGVFANRDFNEGDIVVDWSTCSKKLSKDEFEKLPKGEKKYVSFVDGDCVLLFSPGRYINHSCDSNTCVMNFCDVANRKIKAGEEITVDYTAESVPSSGVKCNCGSDKCKRVLV